jgi:transcription-repair coupling factor (superfamily II helicase)
MRGLLPLLNSEISSKLEKSLNSDLDLIAPPSSYAYLIAAAAEIKPLLVLTASSNAAADLAKEVKELHSNTLEFPAWETLPHERLSPSSDTVSKRISTLNFLKSYDPKNDDNLVVVAPIRAAIQKINSQITNIEPIKLELAMEVDLIFLQRRLVDYSYQRTDLVEKRGQFAVRGGIVDLFPPDQDHPIRIDFFGDEIEDLTYFSISDQRTIEKISNTINILPCRELLIDEQVKQKAIELSEHFENDLIKKISEGLQPEGMESVISLLVDDLRLLSNLMPTDYQAIFIEKERLIARTSDLIATNNEFKEAAWSNAAVGGKAPIEVDSTFIDWEVLESSLRQSVDLRQFGFENDLFLDINSIEPYRGSKREA